MPTETALLLLVSALALGPLLACAYALVKTRGSVKLDFEFGSQSLERALRERDQARALAEETRTELSDTTQALQGVTALRNTVVTHPVPVTAKVTARVYPTDSQTGNGEPFEPTQEQFQPYETKPQT